MFDKEAVAFRIRKRYSPESANFVLAHISDGELEVLTKDSSFIDIGCYFDIARANATSDEEFKRRSQITVKPIWREDYRAFSTQWTGVAEKYERLNLGRKLGRSPSDEEVADALVCAILNANCRRVSENCRVVYSMIYPDRVEDGIEHVKSYARAEVNYLIPAHGPLSPNAFAA